MNIEYVFSNCVSIGLLNIFTKHLLLFAFMPCYAYGLVVNTLFLVVNHSQVIPQLS